MNQKLKVGDSASLRRVFTEADVQDFARISGDDNPIHLDKDFAEASIFGRQIVHGMLVASLFSGLIGGKLPGRGAIYLGQNISFRAPVFIGEQVTASVEIKSIREDKPIMTMSTICKNNQDKVVIEGEAIVKFA